MKSLYCALLVLTAVAARADDVAGHYVLRGEREVGSELLLRPNGTFEYMLAYGAADYQAKGTWRRQNDEVILKSDGKDEPPFRLVRSAASQKGGIRVWVKAANGQGVEQIEVKLQTAAGESEQHTSGDGSAEFPDARQPKSVKLGVRVYDVETGPFQLNPAHNEFYFEINGDAITRVSFKDEPLAIDGKALIMRFWNKDKPIRYERQ